MTYFYLTNVFFSQIFGTPKEHRHSKPYHDHVFVFSIVDDHIWFRNYQVCFIYFLLATEFNTNHDHALLLTITPLATPPEEQCVFLVKYVKVYMDKCQKCRS